MGLIMRRAAAAPGIVAIGLPRCVISMRFYRRSSLSGETGSGSVLQASRGPQRSDNEPSQEQL